MIGTRLGSYEVVEPLGAGGMGEVYRARDVRLHRDVAIKILPRAFAADPDRLARFTREARLLASLNHPNIASIYGVVEDADSVGALVLELVDGSTLAERLVKGPLPVREAIDLARQIVDALEAAHEKGIVHRDLKPANIKLTSGGAVKVLDFGIAKAIQEGVESASPDSATLTMTGTRAGVVLGTPAYMSPEQASGQPVDKRTDIWAFGCVFYEMLTGRATFAGDTTTAVMAAILSRDPDWQALPADTPAHVRLLLQRCLEKDPRRRLRDSGDARIELDTPPAVPPSMAAVPRRGAWIAAGLLAAVLVGVAIGILADRSAPPGPTSLLYVSVPLQGRSAAFPYGTREIAIAPDGSTVAFASTKGLQIRRLDQNDGVIISLRATANNPFFSPDGDWVGFFLADTGLVKVPVRGGAPVTITAFTDRPAGADWRADGTIVYGTSEGLFEVSANGGEPKVIARPDRERGETLYSWPHFLPGGASILYTALSKNTNEPPQTILLDLKSHERKPLLQGSSAVYVASGHLVYFVGSAMNAVTFDRATGAITGKPVVIRGIDVATSTDNAAANFAISGTGTLVYLPPATTARSTFEWIDRRGQREPLDVEPQRYGYAMVSPDGTRVALERWANGSRNIWMLDLKRGTATQLTDGTPEDMLPVWSADGQHIFFASNRTGNFDVYSQAADGASSATVVFAAPGFQAPSAITPDGTRLIVYDKFNDLAVLDLAKPDHLEPLLHSGFDERLGQISPDGRWIAYESDESGNQFEIVLRSFPDVSRRREILSINGGRFPRWGPKGFDELFYLSADGVLMSVPITLSPALAVGTPKKLFDWQKPAPVRSGLLYDVAPDGRFLMPKAQPSSADPQTNVSLVLNWRADLRTRQP